MSPTRVLNSLVRELHQTLQEESNAGVGVQPLTEAALERHNSVIWSETAESGAVDDGAYILRPRRRRRPPTPTR